MNVNPRAHGGQLRRSISLNALDPNETLEPPSGNHRNNREINLAICTYIYTRVHC